MRVVVSPHNVVNYPEGGGHFWVYMQYVAGLRDIGCDVWWMEEFRTTGDAGGDAARIGRLRASLEPYGMGERFILYAGPGEFVNVTQTRAREIFRDTDLLLNFHQKIEAWLLEEFRRTALVDIDPGLLQYWITSGLLTVQPHDLYFTTGETVGKPGAKFPDCGLPWITIRPPVSLELWPYLADGNRHAYTTVSTWWGHEWVQENGKVYDNNKRRAFLRFRRLPQLTGVPLELALLLDRTNASDQKDRQLLLDNGWRVAHAHDVAATPSDYQRYIQSSRGEFSCAKLSCMKFQNAWISDRTLCYLATGRPAVVENTGPSRLLPNGMGLFRFSSVEEAAAALAAVDAEYDRHSRAAREIAELFDARDVARAIIGC